jgi:hypothetical protein
MSWNFNSIPANEHPKIKEALEGHNLAAIILIHDKYELSHHQMCCCDSSIKTELYNEIEFWYNNIRT